MTNAGKPSWAARAGWMALGALIVLAARFAFDSYEESHKLITPGVDFPIEWLVRAGFSEDDLKAIRVSADLRRATDKARQSGRFTEWLKRAGIKITDAELEAVTR